ncbi:MAG: hypothetical protein KC944_24700, partial [Candidatus Omnitrophica bacterium]|nr:hypothetical protein [Candidatus Omnitrophota bacterium]
MHIEIYRVIVIILILLFGAPVPVQAVTFEVPSNFPTIQAAIDSATHGDEIVVATGTYIETLFV